MCELGQMGIAGVRAAEAWMYREREKEHIRVQVKLLIDILCPGSTRQKVFITIKAHEATLNGCFTQI